MTGPGAPASAGHASRCAAIGRRPPPGTSADSGPLTGQKESTVGDSMSDALRSVEKHGYPKKPADLVARLRSVIAAKPPHVTVLADNEEVYPIRVGLLRA